MKQFPQSPSDKAVKPRKAVVAVPPVRDFYFTRHRFSSLGALVIEKILKNSGFETTLLNFPLTKKSGQETDIPGDIAYVKEHIIPKEAGKLSYFTKYHIFGPQLADCARQICSHEPSLCFISCFAFSYGTELLDLSKHVKRINPSVTVVAGGAGISAYPLYFLRDASVDFVITGEAEIGLSRFLDAFVTKNPQFEQVPNLGWKTQGLLTFSPVHFSTKESEILPVFAETQQTKKSVYFSTSLTRGCPLGCEFCSNHFAHGKAFRKVPINEFLYAVDMVSIDGNSKNSQILVNFEDDNLLLDPPMLIDAMKEIRKRFTNVLFLAENGMDYRLLNPRLANELISLGFASFNFTLASTNQEVLNRSARKSSLLQFEAMVRHIASRGIPVLSYFIAGLKGDSKSSVVESMAFLHNLPTSIGLSMFYAVPGMPGFEDFSRFDKIAPCVCNGSSAYPWNNTLTTTELITSFRISRYINLVKSKVKSGNELQLIEMIRKNQKLYTLVKEKKGLAKIVEVPKYDREMVRMFLMRCDGA